MREPAVPGTVLAFDYGEKRIGVAIGETALGIAHPLTTVRYSDAARRDEAIAALVEEWQPAQLVVGLPAHMDGVEHEISKRARKFARALHARFKLPVELVDERLTSVVAEMELAQAHVKSSRRKAVIDQAAAREILQHYFDAASVKAA
jgi:putative Holliday junction resolvase